MYANRTPPDLIVSTGGPAAVFARKHRRDLFPEKPLLFASVDERFLSEAPLGESESAVAVANDFPRQIDEILGVLPDTKQVFMVSGSGALGRFWREQLDSSFARFHDRVTFIWSDEWSFPNILQRVANLPAHSAIVYLHFSMDAQGAVYSDEQVLNQLHAKANAPLFAAFSAWFGYGSVGGSMIAVGDLARNTADAATRILNGEAPASVRIPPQRAAQPTFDWRELRRWGIPESRLPPGSIVEFRPPSLWDEHKITVLTAMAALALESLMIMLLLYERRARQSAEIESRQNLALAADANRRETISALTSSIGHELGQPLSAISHNAQALQMMVSAKRATPDATSEILADIKAEALLATQIIERHRGMLRSRQLQKRPIDARAVIDETLALVAHDMKARQIETRLDLSSTSCVVYGDHVLLEQVLINLVRNAMDALAKTPSARRHITIRSAVHGADVEISVSDTGTGVPAEIIERLFAPFVTTKSHGIGIGLTVAQRIVEAHGGTITAKNLDEGAMFTVTLPRHATPVLTGRQLEPETV
jgi:signal transduction histidine kinase